MIVNFVSIEHIRKTYSLDVRDGCSVETVIELIEEGKLIPKTEEVLTEDVVSTSCEE